MYLQFVHVLNSVFIFREAEIFIIIISYNQNQYTQHTFKIHLQ